MNDATEITNVVFSALSDRKGFDDWFDQIDDELQSEIKTEIAEAIAALRAQPDHSELIAKLRLVAKYHRNYRQESDDAVILAAVNALEGKTK